MKLLRSIVAAGAMAAVAMGCGTSSPTPTRLSCRQLGWTCGIDDYGTSCGTCATGRSCVTGTCVGGTTTCTCSGRNCGTDGCGHSCGTCTSGQTCSASGVCLTNTVADPCNAMGFTCGGCTPITGCGWCGATARCVTVNSGCTGPASGTCSSGWACNPSDCPTTPTTACRGCSSNADCGAGAQCLRRLCDGEGACFASSSSSCLTVDGVACPAVSAYRQCTSDTECASGFACLPVTAGSADQACAAPCSVASDCPPVASGVTAVPYCFSNRCYLSCSGGATCPAGTACYVDSGVYYCL